MKIRISGITRESFVDGPGVRYVVFTQGCPHNCIGCHNPRTHSPIEGELVETDYILKDIFTSKHIDGVTLSGGEPFLQTEALEHILRPLKESGYNIICYTGYKFEDIICEPDKLKILNMVDTLIDGQFILQEKDLKLKFRGSRNQRVIDVRKSLEKGQAIEIEF